MKTFALNDGDLVLSPTGHATISGTQKITTELSLALSEPYGDDRFHPSWGSYLPSYIGQSLNATTQMLVDAEVNRVLQNYIYIQRQDLVDDALNSSRSRYSTADIVSAVQSVDALQSLDTLYVKIVLQTMANETVTLTKVVNL